MALKTIPFDAADYLDTPESQTELIADALASGEPQYIAHALGVVARARGMSNVARETGITREALYRALSEDGDPRLSTFVGVLKALGIKLTVQAADAA
jgi:probable addiction module antidote protein